MTVEDVYRRDNPLLFRGQISTSNMDHPLVIAMALNNDAEVGSDGIALGDPEAALLNWLRNTVFARKEPQTTYRD
jgi:hypothetical protein